MYGTYEGLFSSINNATEDDDNLEPESREQEQSFTERWNWYLSLYELCGNDLRMRNEWLEVTIIEFLNQLSFLKEYNEYKIEEEKKARNKNGLR